MSKFCDEDVGVGDGANRTPRPSSSLWWLKNAKGRKSESPLQELTSPYDVSNSMAEFLETERFCQIAAAGDVSGADIGSIIEEINRLTAQSPGLKAAVQQVGDGDRTIEEIMREAEQLVEVNNRNIERLSSRGSNSSHSRRTSLTTPRSAKSTPRSPRCYERSSIASRGKSYNSDFELEESLSKSTSNETKPTASSSEIYQSVSLQRSKCDEIPEAEIQVVQVRVEHEEDRVGAVVAEEESRNELQALQQQVKEKDHLLDEYERDNRRLRREIKSAKDELEETKTRLGSESAFKSAATPDKSVQFELDKAMENLKDLQEHNTALQLQLDTLNNTHQVLKACNDELTSANKTLERRLIESDTVIAKLKTELKSLQEKYNTLAESEAFLKNSVEVEKVQNKNLKQQNEKDAKCIQDLTRQVREMERIITRKHPDSVSALIVAANTNGDQNLGARKILEDRIQQLEVEARNREVHSTKIFSDVQDKFNEMKLKYESHIEDLENHVADLKSQLNHNVELMDAATQTCLDSNSNNVQSSVEVAIQTQLALPASKTAPKIIAVPKRTDRAAAKPDAHLLATIRGLNLEMSNKERSMLKLQKELEELRRTNKRLQKEREGTLKTNVIIERMREIKAYNPNEYKETFDKDGGDVDNMNLQINAVKDEKDKLKVQLCRLEEDYQLLKLKRLQDLNTLQAAHEQELTSYMGKMAPLREQLEVQQVTINKLQTQLAAAREQIAVLTVERDHLEHRLQTIRHLETDVVDNESGIGGGVGGTSEYAVLRRKIAQLERRYEQRELRLRAIVHGLAQKQTSGARDCEQCALRQQQLCGYKAELDQVLATLRNHTPQL